MLEFKKIEPRMTKNGVYLANSGGRNPNRYISTSIPKFENGKYNTGLDKYTTSVTSLPPKDRVAQIKKLDEMREKIENGLGISLNQDTPEGKEYLAGFVIRLTDLDDIDPANSLQDQLLYHLIKANMGRNDFPISSSREELAESCDSFAPGFLYVVDRARETQQRVSKFTLRNNCLAALQEMYDNDEIKLRHFCGVTLPPSIVVNKETDKNYLMTQLEDYLEGELTTNKTKESIYTNFLSTYKKDNETLLFEYIVIKAIQSSIISKDENNKFYNKRSGFKYGLTFEDVIRELKDPANQAELGTGKAEDNEYSIKAQLKLKKFI